MKIAQMTNQELLNEKERLENWIEGPKNNRKLSTESSTYLDMMWSNLNEVDKELKKREN